MFDLIWLEWESEITRVESVFQYWWETGIEVGKLVLKVFIISFIPFLIVCPNFVIPCSAWNTEDILLTNLILCNAEYNWMTLTFDLDSARIPCSNPARPAGWVERLLRSRSRNCTLGRLARRNLIWCHIRCVHTKKQCYYICDGTEYPRFPACNFTGYSR